MKESYLGRPNDKFYENLIMNLTEQLDIQKFKKEEEFNQLVQNIESFEVTPHER